MFKTEKGITLVALVITIIVMLILAGVSISMVINQDGLIRRSQEAVGIHQNAAAYEDANLKAIGNTLNVIMNTIQSGNGNTLSNANSIPTPATTGFGGN